MAQRRKYMNNAERQKAYIARLKSGVPAPAPQKRQRALSRPRRLQALLSEAEALLESYQEWQEAMPESLQDGETGQRLQSTVGALEDVVSLLENIEAPRGFGRD